MTYSFHIIDSLELKRDTGAEIAVLDSLIKNGTHLDLRAFALNRLPDISLMFSTLVAVDLSYNCLRVNTFIYSIFCSMMIIF